MTVTNATSRGDYNCNGSTQAFSIPFQFFLNTEVQVIKTDTTVSPAVVTTLALTTDYTVSGGAGSTGTFTTVATFPTGIKLSVLPNLPFTQQAHYVPNDPFPAETHEQALDRLDMQDIQLNEKLGRAAVLPPTVSGVNPSLPVPTANAVLMWDPTGTFLTNGTSGSTAFETQNPAMDGTASPGVRGTVSRGDHAHPSDTSRAPNAFTQTGTGAVASTVDAKLKQIINAADWGVKADGVTDDTAAMQAALNAMTPTTTGSLNSAVGNYVLQLPKGTIILSATVAGANSLSQFEMVGQGKRATVFNWAGAASIPVFLFTNCREAVFKDFGIVGNVSAPPSYCIQINRQLSGWVGAGAPTACQFHNIWCGGDSANMASTGIGYTCTAIGDDSNNDLGLFIGCEFDNLSSYGVSFEHGNSLLHRLIACGFSNCGVAAVNAVHVIGTFDSSFDAYDCVSSGCAATWRLGGSTHSVSVFGWKAEADTNALVMPATAGSTYTANLTFSGCSWVGFTGSASLTFDAGVGSTLEICGGKWTSPTALAVSFPTTGSRVKIQDAYFNFTSLTYNNEVDMQNNYVSTGAPTLTNSGSGVLRMVRSDGSGRVNTLPTITSGTSFSASGLSNSLVILNYASGTTLSTITNGYPGQILTLRAINGNATLSNGSSADQLRIVGGTGTTFTLMNGQQITLQKMDSANGNTWVELSRSSPNQIYDATSGAFLYSGRIAGAGALSQWGPINSTTTSATFGAGAVANSLGSFVETLATGVLNFRVGTTAILGGSFGATGKFTFFVPVAATASANFPVGVTVTSPAAGDLWNDANGTLNFKGNFGATGYTAKAVGGSVSSAATITPTGPIFHITGTTTVNTINLPYTGFTGSIQIIPDAATPFGSSGNIATATVCVTGKTMTMTYDGTKWYPSY